MKVYLVIDADGHIWSHNLQDATDRKDAERIIDILEDSEASGYGLRIIELETNEKIEVGDE